MNAFLACVLGLREAILTLERLNIINSAVMVTSFQSWSLLSYPSLPLWLLSFAAVSHQLTASREINSCAKMTKMWPKTKKKDSTSVKRGNLWEESRQELSQTARFRDQLTGPWKSQSLILLLVSTLTCQWWTKMLLTLLVQMSKWHYSLLLHNSTEPLSAMKWTKTTPQILSNSTSQSLNKTLSLTTC